MAKVIFLVDMNSFFISCETARSPELKGKPAAVAGDPKKRSGIVLTANYEARKYNVKTTMTLREAKELCPNIIFVPPDHNYYEKMSKQVMNILHSYSPVIQQNSIDEAWMDVTGCKLLFGEPNEMAQKIMKTIIDELGLPCSIGISENKFLSKMASEMRKPLGITEVYIKDIREKIWPLPLRSMYGIGKQTEKKLSDLSMQTIGDIASCSKTLLVKNFGKYGEDLFNLSNGIDSSDVTDHPQNDSKSISRSTTLVEDTTDIEYAKTVILRLSEEIGMQARKISLKGRTISITLKYHDFKSITRQKAVNPTYLTRDIYETASKLLKDNWNKNRAVRLIGVGLSNIGEDNFEQLTMFNLDKGAQENKKEETLEKAMDLIRERYGFDKLKRAKTLEINHTGDENVKNKEK